jgi:hypothetical protein
MFPTPGAASNSIWPDYSRFVCRKFALLRWWYAGEIWRDSASMDSLKGGLPQMRDTQSEHNEAIFRPNKMGGDTWLTTSAAGR